MDGVVWTQKEDVSADCKKKHISHNNMDKIKNPIRYFPVRELHIVIPPMQSLGLKRIVTCLHRHYNAGAVQIAS